MCFYNDDFEWTAEVCDVTLLPSGIACKCGECGKEISGNEPRTVVKQQEHELCQLCEDKFSDDYADPEECEPNVACKHDYGNTFELTYCEDCRKILAAIKAYEEREACPFYAQQPAYGTLWDELSQHEQAQEYLALAVKMFPEVRESETFKAFGEVKQ